MIGTNDSGGLPVEEFDSSLRRIVDITIEYGVIPVLTTIPPKNTGHPNDGRLPAFNQVIINVAQGYDIPLIDYYSAMLPLPNLGLGDDGVHPSTPANWYQGTGDFSEANLQTGYVMRNLVTLQMLDALWRYVLYDYDASSAAPPAQAQAQPVAAQSTQVSDSDGYACYGAPAPRLAVGRQGRATVTVNVRSLADPGAPDMGDVRVGESFSVLDGPVCAEGFTWWHIEAITGAAGWVANGSGSEYWVEPY
jgi:hypothetical protein